MDVTHMGNKYMKKFIYPVLTIILLILGVDNFTDLGVDHSTAESKIVQNVEVNVEVNEGEFYTCVQDVVEYLHRYGELPGNYLTKQEARDLGWVSSEGNLWDVVPGANIGGDHYGNFEGLLPEKKGRRYQEADINYKGGFRDGERLVYSNDGLYFYTDDHYETFTEMKPVGEVE